MMLPESPCLSCTRVRDPNKCENKTCKDWQAWFIDRWEAMRKNVRTDMEQAEIRETGIPLDGSVYAHPHRVREYLNTDPCDRCLCPRDLCLDPCPAKATWLAKKQEVTP